MDLYLAKHDVLGLMAHITMLQSIGLLTEDELKQLLTELRKIHAQVEQGNFVIEEGVEDVHSQVELMLTGKSLGDVGRKHSGRSCNDQVLLDLEAFTRAQLKEVAELTEQLFMYSSIKAKSLKYTDAGVHPPSDCHAFFLWPLVWCLCREFGGRYDVSSGGF